MAQRVLIAGAVSCDPDLLIADEPTTALDVTVQAEVLDLLRDLQHERHMGVILVTHNFGVVADLCDRVAVMRTGRVVETGPAAQIFDDPQHAYTRMLLDAILEDSEPRAALDAPRIGAADGGQHDTHDAVTDGAEPLLDVDERRRGVPGQRLPQAAVQGPARRLARHPARRDASGWSASPAPARPRSAGRSSASPRSPAGEIRYDGQDISHLAQGERRALSQRHPGRLPGPVHLAEPGA